MKHITLWCTALSLAATTHMHAQTTETEIRREVEIERKEKGKKEKMTIVIEDDKVTINGKPAEEYRGKERIMIGDEIIVDGNRIFNNPRMYGGTTNTTERPMLGVFSSDAPDNKGALIDGVQENTAAERAGLKKGDIITGVNSRKIETSSDLTEAIGSHKPDEEVSITYLRNGKREKTKAMLGRKQVQEVETWNFSNPSLDKFRQPFPPMGESFYWRGDSLSIRNRRGYAVPRMPKLPEFPRFEMEGGNLSIITIPRIRYGMNVQDDEEGRGVLITDVESDANAAKAGLQKGDVITAIDDSPVKDVDSLKTVLEEKKDQLQVQVKVLRDGQPATISVKVPRKLKSATL